MQQLPPYLFARISEMIAASGGAKAHVHIRRGYPVTDNDPALVEWSLPVLKRVAGDPNVQLMPKRCGAEDFSFMLEARPGAFIFIGNGDSAGLHHPAYNFNDEVIPVGTSYWVKLVETALRA